MKALATIDKKSSYVPVRKPGGTRRHIAGSETDVQRAEIRSILTGTPVRAKLRVGAPGQPSDAGTRVNMEPLFGHDFSKMQVPASRWASCGTTPALQMKSHSCLEGNSNTGMVLQLQADPTPPKEFFEEQERQSDAVMIKAPDGKEGFEEEGENRRSLVMQTRSSDLSDGRYQKISPGNILNQLDKGFPLDRALRRNMEGFFGESFSGVKLHNGQQANTFAESLGAHAFTVGDNIAFAGGQYQPGTNEGQKLIAHELTHVVQQRQGMSGDIVQEGIGRSTDKYEMEANQVADAMGQRNHAGSNELLHVEKQDSPAKHRHESLMGNVIQLYSGSTAAAYARKWATGTNPLFGRFGNDCTNFVSQAMEAGGWKMIVGSGYCDDRKKDSVWWFRRGGCIYTMCPWSWCPTIKTVDASHTWGGAQNFYNFVKSSGRGTAAAAVWDLKEGDVLQIAFSGSGHKSHSMVATKKTSKNLYFSYHTTDRLDEPFWPEGSNKGILGRNPDPPTKYYGWRM